MDFLQRSLVIFISTSKLCQYLPVRLFTCKLICLQIRGYLRYFSCIHMSSPSSFDFFYVFTLLISMQSFSLPSSKKNKVLSKEHLFPFCQNESKTPQMSDQNKLIGPQNNSNFRCQPKLSLLCNLTSREQIPKGKLSAWDVKGIRRACSQTTEAHNCLQFESTVVDNRSLSSSEPGGTPEGCWG